METVHAPQNCKWAEPTLYLPLPYWLEAWNNPWSCRRDEPARPLQTTDECRTCVNWEARGPIGIGWTFAQAGL